jgi:hypothetical protein
MSDAMRRPDDEPSVSDRRKRLGLSVAAVARMAGISTAQGEYADRGRGRCLGAYKVAIAKMEVWDAENQRIARQRSVFPEEADDLKQAMLDRALELLEAGRMEEADAILEFVPESDAGKLLEDFFWPEAAADD